METVENPSLDARHDYKAVRDVTHCLVCDRRFVSDDVRSNVYKDDKFMGVIHDTCYELYGNSSAVVDSADAVDSSIIADDTLDESAG